MYIHYTKKKKNRSFHFPSVHSPVVYMIAIGFSLNEKQVVW